MKNYERFISNSPKHIVSGLSSPPTDDGDHPDHDVGEEADPDHRAEEGQHEPVHRRKINAEEKPKFVAAVWGDRIDYFLAAIAVLYQD